MPTTTINKYKTIMADPPWDIQQKGGKKGLGADRHYDLMTLDQIKAMPIKELVADDAHCWLWVTNASLRYGYEVLEAWGFEPRSVLTWCKPRFGLGNYLRNATEHLLLGTRGKAPVNFKGQPTWMFAPLQEHSHKPEEQFAIIERISEPPFLELFARRSREGWDAWGAEIASDIELEGYPVHKYSPKYGVYMEQQALASVEAKRKLAEEAKAKQKQLSVTDVNTLQEASQPDQPTGSGQPGAVV